MNIQDLMKKLHSLKDLRSAISEVKSLTKDEAKVIQMPQKESVPSEKPKMPSNSPLKHMGTNFTKAGQGIIIHQVGVPGASTHYEMHHNAHDAGENKPAFSLQLVNSKGALISKSPKNFNSHIDAAKEIANHSMNGNWSKE